MKDHSPAQPLPSKGITRSATIVLPIILFIVMLFFAVVVTMRYANGWFDGFASGAAATTPFAVDGLSALASIALTALGGVWLYVRTLAR